MKADSLRLVADIINSSENLRIPIYQRSYNWDEEKITRFLDDFARIIDSGQEIFLGFIVFAKTSENEYIIIDGQQRIKTIKILLNALQDSEKNIIDDSLDNENIRLIQNYKICLERVNKWLESGIDRDKIFQALNQIRVIKIELDEGENQQKIFESLNSTGLSLSQVDLIRNFLLMGDNQEKIFQIWQNIARNLETQENLNIFFGHYITFTTQNEVSKENLYNRFVKVFESKNLARLDFIAELEHLSEIYKSFINSDSCKKYPVEVKKFLDDLRTLKQINSYPFLLHVLEDYQENIIDSKTLSKTVRLIFCYVLRCMICRLPDKKLPGLYMRAFKDDKSNYYESIYKSLVIPDDLDFASSLISNNIYSDTNLCKFLLIEIENGDSKEILSTDNLTIEHIMPQSLTQEWQNIISGEEHKLLLHTLGNLTLTGYNAELANKNFLDKKLIFSRSKTVILNSDVINKDKWTTVEIIARGRRLAKILVKRFTPEKIIEIEPAKIVNTPEKLMKISLNNAAEKVNGKNLDSFIFDNKTYKQNNYALMLFEVVKLLDKEKPAMLGKIAREGFSFTEDGRIYISSDIKLLKNHKQIRDGIYLDMGLNAKNIMKFLDSLFTRLCVKKSRFQIVITSTE